MSEFDPKAGDAAMERAMGTELLPGVQEFLVTQTDWFTQCRVCGCVRTGSIADLKVPCDHSAR